MEWLSLFIDVVTAAATVGAVVIALWQVKKTIAEENARRDEDLFFALENEALLVDAWVAMRKGATAQSDPRCLLVRNGTNAPIRNLKLKVVWPDEGAPDRSERDCSCVPDREEPWTVLPPGMWRVDHNDNGRWAWSFPIPIPSEEELDYVPLYSVTDRSRSCHEVQEISFCDAFGNGWIRTFSARKPERVQISLGSTRRARLKRFVAHESEAESVTRPSNGS